MPGGCDMMLSKGAENVSRGQRQLLAIARAIVADPEIMILDEATSNVDAHTGQVVRNAMATLVKGRTSFVVAHELRRRAPALDDSQRRRHSRDERRRDRRTRNPRRTPRQTRVLLRFV
jgi:ABC-type transport system involved in cytochrome bd biosynthesis fused ATPase/permease subunit